ncbi:MAG: flagellar hook protein FlgE [Alphaproteobacteria bacterium]|nr:flagellar hook protein FlgE [Alphaproteobacteria bacterium]
MTSIASASAIAAQGMARASTRLAGAADVIVARGPEIEPIMETMAAKTDFKANAAVLRTADQMMGALLDVIA